VTGMLGTCYRLVSLLALAASAWACGDASGTPSGDPFFDARTREPKYAGPGRGQEPPADLTEVRIGYFGPATASHPVGGDMWCAATMAIERANEAGGYNGIPFRLVAGWSANPWGSGVTEVARMAYVHRVWAIVGGMDGPSTHLAEQVVAKARLALVNPVATDKTVNLANVAWMFTCVPQDPAQAKVLARALVARAGKLPFVMVSAVDHDSHLFAVELRKSLAKRGLAPAYHFQLDPQQGARKEAWPEVVAAEPGAVVLIADAASSASWLRSLRGGGYDGPVFGGPWMGSRAFLQQAGSTADGVIFPHLRERSPQSRQFEEKFRRRFGRRPDCLAVHTYDAVSLSVAAIRRAGLNRARICDALRDVSPWPGVSGAIRWNAVGANAREVKLGTIEGRVVQPLPDRAPRTPSLMIHRPGTLKGRFDRMMCQKVCERCKAREKARMMSTSTTSCAGTDWCHEDRVVAP